MIVNPENSIKSLILWSYFVIIAFVSDSFNEEGPYVC